MEDLLVAARAIVSLAAVLGLLLWLRHRVKKGQSSSGAPMSGLLPKKLARLSALLPARPPGATRAKTSPEKITLVARSGLGGKAQLVVAEFGGIRYVLGVTEQGVSVVDTQETAPEWGGSEAGVPMGENDAAGRPEGSGPALKPVA